MTSNHPLLSQLMDQPFTSVAIVEDYMQLIHKQVKPVGPFMQMIQLQLQVSQKTMVPFLLGAATGKQTKRQSSYPSNSSRDHKICVPVLSRFTQASICYRTK